MPTVDKLIAQAEIFPWNNTFATGIEVIDTQHHKLVDLLNQLAGHMAFGSDELTLSKVFDELSDYAVYHFQTEEGVWNQYLGGDALTLTHAQTHQDFVAQVVKIREQLSGLPSDEAIEELVLFLTHWLAFHILEDDTHMAQVVLAVQSGISLTEAKAAAAVQMKGAARVLIQAVLSMYDSLSTRTLALLREVSQRRRVEEKLRLSSNIIESSVDGIFITDTQGVVIDVNPAFCLELQRHRDELLGQPVMALMPHLFGSAPGHLAWEATQQVGHWAGELRCRRPGGELVPIWLTLSLVKDEAHHTQHFVGVLSSISQLIERHQALETAANHDVLTGLPNRRLLADRLNQAMERSKRNHTTLAVCYLDLDGFKLINDRLGHDAGDVVLQVVAQRMKQVLRGADTVARIGGDEFVLLLCDLTQPREGTALMERLLKEVAQPIQVDSQWVQVGASLGATLFPADSGIAEDLLKHADLALYLAKSQGKGCYRLFEPAVA